MDLAPIEAGILSILPPLIAIALALVTKEVILSLIIGILSGTAIYSFSTGMGALGIITAALELMVSRVSANAEMVIFLVMLGSLTALITRAGGSRAYGLWASARIKNGRSAGLAASFLGLILFIDDYFSIITAGTVMRPVTDRNKISREKLAYIINTTAAPVCIIVPVSSYAASVISYFPEHSSLGGMQAFLSSIPMNLYALLSIFMVFWFSVRQKGDYGPMAKAESRAETGQVSPPPSKDMTDEISKNSDLELVNSKKGLALDMLVPVLVLAAVSVTAMITNTDAGLSLAMGAFASLIMAFLLYVPRRLLKVKDFFSSVTAGAKTMVPAIIILSLAWTIAHVCRDLLSTSSFIAGLAMRSNLPIALIPAIMFLTACVLSFATGTSWGTFGILIPITIDVCSLAAPELTVTALSAVLAGSVFGDHCSPLSDCTILSSTGAQCPHMDHVSSQLPYALTAASVCLAGFVIAGLTSSFGYAASVAITLSFSIILLITVLLIKPKIIKNSHRMDAN